MTSTYYKLPAEDIVDDVESSYSEEKFEVCGIQFSVLPHVYPSQKFRTTGFVLSHIKPLLVGKNVCDMGCGPGVVGLLALHSGANSVVQADINPHAVENAKMNNDEQGFGADRVSVYLSNCFDSVPENIFDVIVFNMPFHNDDIEISNPLEHAFYDPLFKSLDKFLKQAKSYTHQETMLFIAFSNKGDVAALERIFSANDYTWELWKVANQEEQYDSRIYKLTL